MQADGELCDSKCGCGSGCLNRVVQAAQEEASTEGDSTAHSRRFNQAEWLSGLVLVCLFNAHVFSDGSMGQSKEVGLKTLNQA